MVCCKLNPTRSSSVADLDEAHGRKGDVLEDSRGKSLPLSHANLVSRVTSSSKRYRQRHPSPHAMAIPILGSVALFFGVVPSSGCSVTLGDTSIYLPLPRSITEA